MKRMSDNAFLDTNIWIYMYSEKEPAKRAAAYHVLNQHNCISSLQIFNEASNVWTKKFGWNGENVKNHLHNIELVCDDILTIGKNTIYKALSLKDTYKFSYFDSVMLASALEGHCSVIYTEDMNDGQLIEGCLRIVNPFRNM
jgi:predicted nucleic acid-binding protein